MINRLKFAIAIRAEKTKIWKALWDDSSYRDWASVFFEGSYAICESWEEGGKVLFLAPDQSGIFSIIEKHIPNEMIRFKHVGTVVKGIEQPMDEATKEWSGATETYTLTKTADSNTLTVEIDVLDEHLDFMKERLPKALEKVKINCC